MNTYQAAMNIAAQLEKNIGYYTDEKPVVKKIDGTWMVIWECGPMDWASNDNYYLHEELVGLGYYSAYEPANFWTEPNGFYAEAFNSYSIGVYEE